MDEPTELTHDSFTKCFIQMLKFEPHRCSWCNESYFVREVGPNYICYECEIKERAANRPLVFTAPVRDAYFKIMEEE